MENTRNRVGIESGSTFIGLTFLYMFLALAITAGVAFGVSQLFSTIFPIVRDGNQVSSANATIYFIVLFVSAISVCIVAIWFRFAAFKAKNSISIWIPFIIDAILMGVLCSSFTLFVDGVTLVTALGITTLMFGSMALFGFVLKRLNFILVCIVGLSTGLMMFLFGGLLFALLIPGFSYFTYGVTSLICFVLCALITIIDVARIRVIAERGEATDNLALYCAFDIYLDFIVMFMRVVRILAVFRRN